MPRANSDTYTGRPGEINLFPTMDLSQVPTNLTPSDSGAMSNVTGGRGYIPAPAGTGNLQELFSNWFAPQTAARPQPTGFQPMTQSNLAQMPGYQHLQQPVSDSGMNSFFNYRPSPYLEDWAKAPRPIDQLPAWDAMRASQQRNIDQGAGQLNEFFNTMGGRFSTGYGTAMSDYFSQTKKDQNAMLSMLENQALEAALGRQYGAASQLGQYDYGLESQKRGFGFAADMYNAQAADAATNALASNSLYGTGQLYGNSNLAAQLLSGTENQAAMGLFGGQTNALPLAIQAQMQKLGYNTNLANLLNQNYTSNLGLGMSLGGQQYTTLQDQIDRAYQEFIRTSPQYNPWTQMMQQLAMAQSSIYFPQYTPSVFGQLAGMAGSILGGPLGGRIF